MREIFTYGSVGRAPGDRCLYAEPDRKGRRPILKSSFCDLGDVVEFVE